jgi:hypothetical protein
MSEIVQEEQVQRYLQMLPNGILRDITKYIVDRCPTSYSWAECQSLVLLSLAMGLKRHIKTKMGRVRAHLFILNVGPSRIAFKTVPIKYYSREILLKMCELGERNFKMAKRHTVEAMIGILSEGKNKKKNKKKKGNNQNNPEEQGETNNQQNQNQNQNQTENTTTTNNQEQGQDQDQDPLNPNSDILLNNEAIMIYDEISSFFKDTKNKKWMSDALEFISELWDNWVGERETKTHGHEGGVRAFISILGATTDHFFETIDRSFFVQGTGNRFLFVLSMPRDIQMNFDTEEEEASDFFGLLAGETDSNMDEDLENFAKRILFLRDNAPNTLEFTNSAALLAYKYYKNNHKMATRKWSEDRKNIEYSYLSERSILMIKLAGLYALSNNEQRIVEGLLTKDSEDSIIITEKAVKWAILRMEEYSDNFVKLIDMWTEAKARGETVKIIEDDYKYIKSILRRHGGMLNRTQLARKTKYSSRRFREIINSAVQQKVLYLLTEIEDNSTGGRPKGIYCLPEFFNKEMEKTEESNIEESLYKLEFEDKDDDGNAIKFIRKFKLIKGEDDEDHE